MSGVVINPFSNHIFIIFLSYWKKDYLLRLIKHKVRFEGFEEGICAQIMHIGPYADGAPIIEKLHKFIGESGKELKGKHHEIYLNDVRRTSPEKLKTIIRQPME